MQLEVKGRNIELGEADRLYAETKLAKLGRQLAEGTSVEVELSEERNPSIADAAVAEATIFAKGSTIRARESASDLHAAIDLLEIGRAHV